MALYLGNQKVSLRSGQDSTFDYGFNSSGRLVFANKNATEINNFLNYDSSYSEILDLSNLNKMEKVAVNGTVDRKMEGLKGLLVSPNAPFTGSSPQINASYTGLNKSALVSLFESAPYNVGYTKVGNPTIVDGVASGFSEDDSLKTTTTYTIQDMLVNNYEFATKITTTGNNNSECYAIRYYSSYVLRGLGIYNDKLSWAVGYPYSSSFTGTKTISANWTVTTGTTYWLKGTIVNKTVSFFYSLDGKNYSLIGSEDYTGNTFKITNSFMFGSTPNDNYGVLNGSIDLKETYIKINDVYWFRGQPAMTKTCSIVGATGTTDLTQEDKNIILNKGWSLTVQ